MNLKATLEAAAQVYTKKAKANPNGSVEVFGERVPYATAASELRKVVAYVYPELNTSNVQQVVRCKDCKHYKRYRSKKNPRAPGRWLCALDKKERVSEFFCADGEERK